MTSKNPKVVFARSDVVDFYANFSQGLFLPEKIHLENIVKATDHVLDIGVGAGRTANWFFSVLDNQEQYIGIDVSETMVQRCKERFPFGNFTVEDAKDLSRYPDKSFDVIFFSFNGMDYLENETEETSFLMACFRLLRPGGNLFFSRHDPRVIFTLPNPVVSYKDKSINKPMLTVSQKKIWLYRIFHAVRDNLVSKPKRLCTKTFWKGRGRYLDHMHDGVWFTAVSPRQVKKQMTFFGFTEKQKPIGNSRSRFFSFCTTDWWQYHYVKDDLGETQ